MEVSSRGFFVLLMLFFMFLTPGGSPPRVLSPSEKAALKKYISRQLYELEVVQNSTWQSGYSNLTGLYESKNAVAPGSILPTEIFEAATKIWNLEEAEADADNELSKSYYTNVSGSVKGDWGKDQINLTPINMTTPRSNATFSPFYVQKARVAGNEFSTDTVGNITQGRGRLNLGLNELKLRPTNWNISIIEASMDLMDENDGDRNTINMRGLHFTNTGNMVLSTNSFKFSGFAALPQLVPTPHKFDEARDLVVMHANNTINKAAGLSNYEMNINFELYEEAMIESHKCEYIVYAHLYSSGLSPDALRQVEDELEHPMGRPHQPAPDLKVDAIMYSPDCAVSLTSNTLKGETTRHYQGRMRGTIMCAIFLILAQIVFTAVQMRETSTPSTISRVSFYSVGIMALFDGSSFFTALAFSATESVALSFLAVAFIAFALTVLFELRYMVLIYKSQIFENYADERIRQSTSPELVARADGRIVGRSEPPAGEQQEEQHQEQRPAPIDDERQLMGMIYSRFYALLLSFLIISITATTWPVTLRLVYEYCISVILYSFWIPQIVRNVRRGARRSFLWSYVLATSFIRLGPVLYACLYPNNVLSHRYDSIQAMVVGIWVAIQVALLAAQTLFGPRFFLPKGYMPTLYDYHPIITEEDLETGFNYSDLKAENDIQDESEEPQETEEQSAKHPTADCAICMNPVELVIVPRNGSQLANTPTNILARRRYMVTPCRHVFHSECMERWMRTRLQCPVCRNPLPPV